MGIGRSTLRPYEFVFEYDRIINFMKNLKQLLQEKNAVLIAHYYTDAAVQKLADETGGLVADSLEMARFGNKHPATTLVVAGVKFMGETAKILNPEKKVLLPTIAAKCSLDLSCPYDKFAKFCHENSDRTVVVYANSSAKVKALADWVVTSSIALDVVRYLNQKNVKIIFAPDRFLGDYIKKQTNADMLIWQGSCIVHEKFKAAGIINLKKIYPDAGVLVHPESPADVIALADVVGSTSQLLKAANDLPNKIFIVATDEGILYKMRQQSPQKQFIIAPNAGNGATCKSCAHCPWMELNTLEGIEKCLLTGKDEILLAPEIIAKALIPLKRMLEFNSHNNL